MFLDIPIKHLHCTNCGKRVSTGFIPQETDTPDKGLIVRAIIECPECVQERNDVLVQVQNTLKSVLDVIDKKG